jgi:hypothetical protein
LEKQVYRVDRAKPEFKVHRAILESRAKPEFRDHKAIQVYKVQRGIRAKRA